jgi:hypothetical protein
MSDEAHVTDFIEAANQINEATRAAVGEILAKYRGPLSMPHMVVAAMSGMVGAAGYLCAHFEPEVDAAAFAEVLPAQFDEGRQAYRQSVN